MKRHVFMLSDGTGITVEHLGNSLISQFKHLHFEKHLFPYIDSSEKAQEVLDLIHQKATKTASPPIVFMTIVNLEIVAFFQASQAVTFDLFNTFIEPLEKVLHTKSSYTVGQAHSADNLKNYTHRMEAVDFALNHDDGIHVSGYGAADLILIGVSRSGKTPSCLYMALNFGIKAANYPFTEDDLSWHKLPEALKPFLPKLFGLIIEPFRLHQIRSARAPNSHYASLEQCRIEINELLQLYQREKIPYLDSTNHSVEEIATKILSITDLRRA